ncbi:MAG: hypothetical protein KKF44_10450 [Nanoarchaeota archaeon]|nr:hypothetical protein [Nanoarchaeota archaeon]
MPNTKIENAEKYLSNAPSERAFFVCDGTCLLSLEDTSKFLKTVKKEVFTFHVNKDKNDFYNWIKEIIGDTALAGSIKNLKTSKSMSEKISRRVKELKKTV